jgi:hypothetical protein
MMFAAAVGHRSGRATPSLRDAPQQQSMEMVGTETIYRNRNAVQTNPATSKPGSDYARRRLMHRATMGGTARPYRRPFVPVPTTRAHDNDVADPEGEVIRDSRHKTAQRLRLQG